MARNWQHVKDLLAEMNEYYTSQRGGKSAQSAIKSLEKTAEKNTYAKDYLQRDNSVVGFYTDGKKKSALLESESAAKKRAQTDDKLAELKSKNYFELSSPQSMRYLSQYGTKSIDKPRNTKKNPVNAVAISTTSKAIGKVRYNPETKNLYVKFRNGDKEYLFPEVTSAAIKGLLTANSKGRAYHKKIKPFAVSKEEALAIKERDNNR